MSDTVFENHDYLDALFGESDRNDKAEFHEFFPQVVYSRILNPETPVFNAMLKFVEMFDESNRNEPATRNGLEVANTDDLKSMPDPDDGPSNQTAITGDVTGKGVISTLPEFQWLTQQVEKCVFEYLDRLQVNTQLVSLFHQKSWPVVARKDTKIPFHTHPNAAISAVYYFSDAQKGEGGNLLFNNPNNLLIPGRVVGDNLYKNNRMLTNGIRPRRNMLAIFPSMLPHCVSKFQGDQNRYSITYDIMMTAARDVDPGASENIVPHPGYWSPFSKQAQKDNT